MTTEIDGFKKKPTRTASCRRPMTPSSELRQGVLSHANIFGRNFGREINGTVPRSAWKFPIKVVHLQILQIRPKLAVPFLKILVSGPTLLSSNQNFGRSANGSLRFDFFFDRTMSLHFS